MSEQTLRHPMLGLLARYRAVWRAAWEVRDELVGPKRLADEAAFLPAALSLQETPVHPAPRRAVWAIITLFVVALAWSTFGKVDIVATAQGQITVADNTKVIQPLTPAVVKAIQVKDGAHVRRGQVLVELDATGETADANSVQEQLASSTSDMLRSESLLQALQTGHAPRQLTDAKDQAQLEVDWADIQAKRAKLESDVVRLQAEIATAHEMVDKLSATLPMARQREKDYLALAAQGDVAKHAGQDKTRERVEMERDLATEKARLQEAQAQWVEGQRELQSYIAESQQTLSDKLSDAKLKVAQLTQEQAKAQQKQRLTQLTSPVDGTVQQLAIHTPGGVVTAAQQLMVVVPDKAQVTADVVIDNKDIGFIREGQPAEIKLETFNFTRYGAVPAHVTWVTADAVNDEKRGPIFPATLTLDRGTIEVDGKLIHITPGMSLSAEIKTGQRRVIEYLLSPVEKRLNESLKER